MNEVLHANIFFIIASVATVVFCILVSVILYQVIKIMKIVRRVLERVEAGSEMLAEDLSKVRSFFAEGGPVARFIGFFVPTPKSTRRRRSKSDADDEL
jgi:membrane protein DedA with SNARE-associated domain